jgi:hypothetical protein
MNWFFRWFQRGLNHAAREMEALITTNEVRLNTIPGVQACEDLGKNPLRLRIFRANGGTVIEARQYDRNDHDQVQLHIVGHDSDLGHSIAKIITMESLRQ